MFMKFLFLSWILTRHFLPGSFVQPFFATNDTAVVSVEPETERQGDSFASAINVTAGVDVGHSGHGNEASELDGDKGEYVFCFCSPCVTCVRQQWLGHGQEKFWDQEERVLKLEGSIQIHLTLQTLDTSGSKGRHFLFHFYYCVSASFAYTLSMHVLMNTCVATYT